MSRPTRLVMAALLAALSIRHIGTGLYYLAVQQPATGIADLRNRRVENAYFLDRISPLSQQVLASEPGSPLADGADPRLPHGAEFANGALPPWTYPLQLAIAIPASERIGRLYLAALDLGALAVVAWLALIRVGGSGADRSTAALAVLSTLAIGAVNSTMSQGQNGLIVNAGLALVLAALVRRPAWGRAALGGAAFALAMTKPSSALPFVLPALARRRWTLLTVSGVVLGAAALCASWWLRHPLLFQWRQFEHLSRLVIAEGANPALNRFAAATSAELAREVFGVAGLAIAGAAVHRLNRSSMFVAFAVLAVVARLFTYHRAYDDVLLAFLMIELAARACAPGASPRWPAAWLVGGASLWLPYSLDASPAAQAAQVAAWCGLALLLVFSGEVRKGGLEPPRL